jgi:acetylglutamate kinase
VSVKIVVKMGGSTLDSGNILVEFADALSLAPEGSRIAVVHGGGKDIGRQLERMGREFTFIDGLRVTDDETIDIVEMVLSGLVNKWIVRALEKEGLRAAGISGTDLGLFRAVKLTVKGGDLGYVGAIEEVNTELVDILLDRGVIPVVSPISIGPGHRAYNVNADHAAQKLAEVWRADHLVYVTDVPGIKVGGEVRPEIRITEIEKLIDSGEVTGGMIPKLMSAASAVMNGVGRVHIIGWKGRESIADSLSREARWGTVIC